MKKVFRYLSIAVILLLIGFISFLLYETQDQINATPEHIEDILNRFYNKERLGGFSVSVFNKDSVIYRNSFGYSNVEKQIPYSIHTQQYIASISKTSIGIALLKAEELGLLNIDDPINKHLPFKISNPNHPNEAITIKHLATHTSSLDYNEKVVESLYINSDESMESLRPFIHAYFENKEYGEVTFTNHKPGENWNYSNIGAGLAAYLIEATSGMSFSAFSKKYIFDPLDLNHTFWFETEADSANHSLYYESLENGIKQVETSGVKLYPCRDMITTIENLTTYCQAIIRKDNRILNDQSFDKLLSPQLSNSVTNQSDDNHGLFFQIDRNQYGITYQLTGGTGGDNCINTMMLFDPYTELGYIFIGNTGHSQKNRFTHIRIYRAIVSLGDHFMRENSETSWIEKMKFKWHNYYNRVVAIF